MRRSISLSRTLGLVLAVGSASLALASSQAPVPQVPPDNTLKDRIEYRLETSPVTDRYDLTVNVDAACARLSGTVATAPQKAEAGRLAKIDGISTVENEITVDKTVDRTLAERAKAGMTQTGEAITDGWITTKVTWCFVGEGLLKGSHINVDTDKNVVTLKGTVTSGAGRDRAVALAKRTGGVPLAVRLGEVSQACQVGACGSLPGSTIRVTRPRGLSPSAHPCPSIRMYEYTPNLAWPAAKPTA